MLWRSERFSSFFGVFVFVLESVTPSHFTTRPNLFPTLFITSHSWTCWWSAFSKYRNFSKTHNELYVLHNNRSLPSDEFTQLLSGWTQPQSREFIGFPHVARLSTFILRRFRHSNKNSVRVDDNVRKWKFFKVSKALFSSLPFLQPFYFPASRSWYKIPFGVRANTAFNNNNHHSRIRPETASSV